MHLPELMPKRLLKLVRMYQSLKYISTGGRTACQCARILLHQCNDVYAARSAASGQVSKTS